MSKDKNPSVLEGSQAIALTVKNIAPAVVSAYPITPQTHIVEDLARFKADGQASYSYVRAESEFAAASIILGASAAGERVYSATSSQGLLLMTEVLYNIAGLRLPAVMTCADRAVSAPINIWNDQSDAMSIRDCGWLQIFAGDNQEAADLHVLAFRLAEKLRLPVMVHVDGFILTHAFEKVCLPSPEEIKAFLPPYRPQAGTYLDPKHPKTFGVFAGTDSYFEIRQQLHQDLLKAVPEFTREYRNWMKIRKTGSDGGNDRGLYSYYGSKNPEVLLVALGSVSGTIREVLKNEPKAALLQLRLWRPFPVAAIAQAVSKAKHLAVIEKAVSLGQAGPLFSDIKASLSGKIPPCRDYIVGLGGRDVTEKNIRRIIKDAKKSGPDVNFFGEL